MADVNILMAFTAQVGGGILNERVRALTLPTLSHNILYERAILCTIV